VPIVVVLFLIPCQLIVERDSMDLIRLLVNSVSQTFKEFGVVGFESDWLDVEFVGKIGEGKDRG